MTSICTGGQHFFYQYDLAEMIVRVFDHTINIPLVSAVLFINKYLH